MIDLVTRAEWGARYADGFRDRPMPFTEFWLHHSVTIAPDLLPPFTDDDIAVRTLENIGQSRFKGGISYNQPVTPVGRVYVGVSPHRQGAHTRGHNTAGFAFVLVGDYSKRPPTAIQEEMIARRMVELHRARRATRHTLNGGHRDADTDPNRAGVQSSTACPGAAAHARIRPINTRADELWAAGYGRTGSDVNPPLPKPDDDTAAGGLPVDGDLGPRTILRWQAEMASKGHKITLDGVIDPEDSLLVRAVQANLNSSGFRDHERLPLKVDGRGIARNVRRYPSGDGTTRTLFALERKLGRPLTGYLGARPSDNVKALQRLLNADTY